MKKIIVISLIFGLYNCSLFQQKPTPKPIIEPIKSVASVRQKIDEESPVDTIAALLKNFTNTDDDELAIEDNSTKQNFNKALKYSGESIINGRKIKWTLKISPNKKEERFQYIFILENKRKKDKVLTLRDKLTIVHDDPAELIKIIENILQDI